MDLLGIVQTNPFDSNALLPELESRFPRIFRIFEQVGIHPKRSHIVYNPYTSSFSTGLFTNIGDHCIAVAYAAAKLMGTLIESDVTSRNDLDYAIERALLHDITKPYEIMLRDAQLSGFVFGLRSTNADNQLQLIMQKMGFKADDMNYILTAGSETGHDSLKDFLVINGHNIDLVNDRFVEKVVHLADDMTYTSIPPNDKAETATTLFLTPEERMSASRFSEQYPWLWKSGLACTAGGKIVHVEDTSNCQPELRSLGDYAFLQIKVARAIAREFQRATDPNSDLDSGQYIKQLINRHRQTN